MVSVKVAILLVISCFLAGLAIGIAIANFAYTLLYRLESSEKRNDTRYSSHDTVCRKD